MEVTKWLKPSDSASRIGDGASVQAVTRVNAEQASKRTMRRPTRRPFRGKRLTRLGERAKAKAEAGYRFYALYDKISPRRHPGACLRSVPLQQGRTGCGRTGFCGHLDVYGVQRWLGELALALRQETYRPDPIRRVFIPKANGKLRPLGISTLRDRVCMTAATPVLEPIFEADLPPEQYAYRPGRNAQQAVVEVEALLFRGHPEVVDADLADYFGSIPHAELLKSVARRIVDWRVLHLIKMRLPECPVEENDDRGRKTRTTEGQDKRCGIPQGSPISPLLANLYMRRFVLGWEMLGLERSLGTRIVTYADDLVILCRKGNAEEVFSGVLSLSVSVDVVARQRHAAPTTRCGAAADFGNCVRRRRWSWRMDLGWRGEGPRRRADVRGRFPDRRAVAHSGLTALTLIATSRAREGRGGADRRALGSLRRS